MTAQPPHSLSKRLVFTESPDGAVEFEETGSQRRMSLIMNILVLCIVVPVVYAVFKPADLRHMSVADPVLWIAVGIGLYFIYMVLTIIVEYYGSQQWIASENSLTRRTRLFGCTWNSRFTNGRLTLEMRLSRYGTQWYTTAVRAPGRWGKRIYTSLDRSVIEDLANYLAQRLQWPIENRLK